MPDATAPRVDRPSSFARSGCIFQPSRTAAHLLLLRHLRVVIVAWLVTGFGAVAGSVLGNAFGRRGLFIGATIAGTLALLLAIQVLTALRWLDAERRRGGTIGGLVGFALASPLAVMNLHTPVIPIVVTSLVGVGVVLGAGRGAVQ